MATNSYRCVNPKLKTAVLHVLITIKFWVYSVFLYLFIWNFNWTENRSETVKRSLPIMITYPNISLFKKLDELLMSLRMIYLTLEL